MITGNRCGRPFEDLDFCVDANNVLNLASTGSIIGNWEIDDKQQFGTKIVYPKFDKIQLIYLDYYDQKWLPYELKITRMCEKTEDCYDVISHWNLRENFLSQLQMICTPSGFCQSTNQQLWRTGGSLSGNNFCDQTLDMENIFAASGSLRDRSFKR